MEKLLNSILDRKDQVPEEEIVDGGTIDRSNHSAAKAISCTEIIAFECTASTLDLADEDVFRDVFTFTARLAEDKVEAGYKCRKEQHCFTASAGFMDKLQELVTVYGFAKHNGINVCVSGLPDMYGAYLYVEYKNGECISANHNQDSFISYEAVCDLMALFKKQDN